MGGKTRKLDQLGCVFEIQIIDRFLEYSFSAFLRISSAAIFEYSREQWRIQNVINDVLPINNYELNMDIKFFHQGQVAT